MIKLLYISQLGEPEAVNLHLYDDFADGIDDADWFETRLKELGLADQVSMTKIRVCPGQTIPRGEAFDAAVLGGSEHSVAEQRPWQVEVSEWLKYWRGTGQPMLGICGGHQLMGVNAGASVIDLPGGAWNATKTLRPTAPGRGHWLFRDLRDGVPIHFSNSQHVASVPESAIVLATVEASPAIALDYRDGWVGLLGHPEMTVEVFKRYLSDKGESDQIENYSESENAPLILRNFIEFASNPS